MSRNHGRKAADTTRRNKRSSAPTLSPLEDRRLMTRGFAAAMMAEPAMAGGFAPGAPQALVAAHDVGATDAVKLSFEGDTTTLPATTAAFPGSTGDEWVYSGSDAQFGPMGYLALSPSGQAWPSPSSPSSPDASTSQAALDAAFAKQSTDMQAIQDKSEVTPKLIASLRTARLAVANEAGEADPALAAAFQADVQAVQQSGTFTAEQAAKLKDGYTVVLKSAGVSDAAISGLFAAQDAVKAASKLTSDDVKLLSDDQAAIQALFDAMPKTDAPFMAMDGGATPIAARADLGGAYMNMAPGAPGMAAGGAAGTYAVTSLPVGGATSADPATLAATSGIAAGDGGVAVTSATGAEGAPILYSTTADQPVDVTTTSVGAPVTTTARPTTPSAPAGYYQQEGGIQPVSLGNFGRRVTTRSGATRLVRSSLNGVASTVGNGGGARTPSQVVTTQSPTGQPIAQSLGALGRRTMGLRPIRTGRVGF